MKNGNNGKAKLSGENEIDEKKNPTMLIFIHCLFQIYIFLFTQKRFIIYKMGFLLIFIRWCDFLFFPFTFVHLIFHLACWNDDKSTKLELIVNGKFFFQQRFSTICANTNAEQHTNINVTIIIIIIMAHYNSLHLFPSVSLVIHSFSIVI